MLAVATVVQCDGGKHGGGCLGGRGGHGKRGGGALNIIVGVPTPVPTPVPVPTYAPMQTVGRVHYEPQAYQTKQQVQVPVTTKQQFQGQGTTDHLPHLRLQHVPHSTIITLSVLAAYVPQTYGKAGGAYAGVF